MMIPSGARNKPSISTRAGIRNKKRRRVILLGWEMQFVLPVPPQIYGLAADELASVARHLGDHAIPSRQPRCDMETVAQKHAAFDRSGHATRTVRRNFPADPRRLRSHSNSANPIDGSKKARDEPAARS